MANGARRAGEGKRVMFKKSYNRAVIRLRIETVTPLLIRAGDAGLDPTAAALTCVRTHHAKYGSTVYIPGSSLKGVLRAAAECSVRGRVFELKRKPEEDPERVDGACNPLDHTHSCGGVLSSEMRAKDSPELPSAEVHRRHCLACRLFGSLAMKGRASVRDLFPWDAEASAAAIEESRNRANALEMRHGVSINRVSGAVQNGPFEQEMVPAGVSFWGEVALENYQVWQLGFLAQAIEEVNSGFAQLGSTKSRGLGVTTIHIVRIRHEQRAAYEGGPAGAGLLAGKDDTFDYGLFPDRALPPASVEPRGIAHRYTVEGEASKAWMEAGVAALGDLT